jgi:hypothetical protein
MSFWDGRGLLNPLTPELNPSAQRCLLSFFTVILIFEGLTARRLYKSFGVKGLNAWSTLLNWGSCKYLYLSIQDGDVIVLCL